MKIRLEEPRDYQLTEELTRDAFWNKYHPGCSEHYVLHQFRDRSEFVPELDYVTEDAGQILAHIMYARAEIQLDTGGVLPLVVFGPVSVRPDRQGEGIGQRNHSSYPGTGEENGLWSCCNYRKSRVL